ncbi:quaternary ammonium compound efflux SMR transporter SugE [Stutzerimonas urumqiensis]|uniref:quaternary ammonium compound efflux SMR transporter SugE n=1 Tax=Stutzerimonas urumqiensis TaxID=638269 RepID=UPI000EACA14C|nr:quaternary ammonium compound efflux SMR transporter SugE [Stutzerimonas urumqiensis]
MSWLYLVLAGLLEIVWAIGLKYTEGFSRLVPSLVTLAAMVGSFYLLSAALRTLPIGTAYGVWVGIGTVGTAIAGVVLFHETVTPLKLVSIILVVAGIAGLKLSTAA